MKPTAAAPWLLWIPDYPKRSFRLENLPEEEELIGNQFTQRLGKSALSSSQYTSNFKDCPKPGPQPGIMQQLGENADSQAHPNDIRICIAQYPSAICVHTAI